MPAGLEDHMHRLLSIAGTTAVLVLLSSTVAAAKGPSDLTITGEGLDGPIGISAVGDGRLSEIAEHTGLYATLSSADGRELGTQRPGGDLGPALTLTWTVPMSDAVDDQSLVQRLHPWADGGPVTHTEGGQRHFGHETVGGWYAGGQELAAALSDAGVPPEPPGTTTTRTAVGLGGMIAMGLVLLAAQRAARPRRGAVAAPA